jgi:hypothetical protein
MQQRERRKGGICKTEGFGNERKLKWGRDLKRNGIIKEE